MNPEIKIIIEFRSQEEASLRTMDVPQPRSVEPVEHGLAHEPSYFMHHGVQYYKSRDSYWTRTGNVVENIAKSTYYTRRAESDYVK